MALWTARPCRFQHRPHRFAQMGLHVVSLTSRNLRDCEPLWSDRSTYTEIEFTAALSTMSRLLDQRRALGAVVLDAKRVHGFGATVFADTKCVAQYLATPHAQIGKRLLLDAARGDDMTILTPRAIGQGNAGTGLDLVVVNTNYDRQAPDADSVIGLIIQAYQDTHRGYRLARLVNEVIGDHAVEVMETSRTFVVESRFENVGGVAGLRSALGTLTREHAAASRNPLLPMFVYSPPRILFTESEQRLLSAAMDGGTDEALSGRLGVPITAVKARWGRIQQRALRRAPDEFGLLEKSTRHNRRGPQHRHLILEYLRRHPSELTPYVRPARKRME